MNVMREKRVSAVLLWLLMIVSSAETACRAACEIPVSGFVDLAAKITFPVLLMSWVYADAESRHRKLCYDYDTFLFFAWPLVVPCYLFQTRGVRAFLTLLCFVGMYLVAALVAGGVYWVVSSATR